MARWVQLEGNALLYTVSLLTCMGFLLIGYDNGLMGGLVNTPHFDSTFNIDTDSKVGTDMIALIVAIVSLPYHTPQHQHLTPRALHPNLFLL